MDAMTAANDMPRTQCPKCLAWVEDFDGFGVLAHLPRDHADGCGYCSHPAVDDDVCGVCRATIREVRLPSGAVRFEVVP